MFNVEVKKIQTVLKATTIPENKRDCTWQKLYCCSLINYFLEFTLPVAILKCSPSLQCCSSR